MNQPNDDDPDAVGSEGVSISDEDARLSEERTAWSTATRRAQSLHSANELLAGLTDTDWRVRHESVDRLIARAGHDPRTLPALLRAAVNDEIWQVRDEIVMRLVGFEAQAVVPTLLAAERDSAADVRWAAQYVLSLLGLRAPPGDLYSEASRLYESIDRCS